MSRTVATRGEQGSADEKVLAADGRAITVSGLRLGIKRTTLAYNLSVEGIHTYHVGADQILVHNDCLDFGSGWRATSFGDEAASVEYHYAKHGVGVTKEQYAQDALAWARNPAGTGSSVQLKDGTEGIRYRTPGGGSGGILDLDGNIITFWYR